MPLRLVTPLGDLTFFAAVGPEVIGQAELHPDPCAPVSCSMFETTTARGEVRVGVIDPFLLPEQHVDACYGVMWRVEALTSMPDVHRVEFTCTWGGAPTWTDLGWTTGQTVQSRSWRRDLTQVNVGTIDADGGLPWYAELPEFALPSRWFQTTADGGRYLQRGGVQTSVAGVLVTYPNLRQGEVCHAQFVVAWKERRDAADDDTDFAVDVNPVHIVQTFDATDTISAGIT